MSRSTQVRRLSIEDLSPFLQDLWGITDKVVMEFFCRFLKKLGYELHERGVYDLLFSNSYEFSWLFINTNAKKGFEISGKYQYEHSSEFPERPKDSYRVQITMQDPPFTLGYHVYLQEYIEDRYGVKLVFRKDVDNPTDVKGAILNVSKLSKGAIRKKLRDIICLHEWYFRRDETLYRVIKGELRLEEYSVPLR